MRRRLDLNLAGSRSLFLAAAAGLVPATARAVTATDYAGPSNAIWGSSFNWDNGLPATGEVANLFSGALVNYNLPQPTPAVDLLAVQIAKASTLQLPYTYGSPYLQATTLYLGGSVTGANGLNASTGAGTVLQTAGTVYLDPATVGTSLLIDPVSTYSLSGFGTLQANAEQIGGQFLQSAGANNMQSGAILSILSTGTYNLSGSGLLITDAVFNAGLFVNSGGTMQGTTGSGIAFTNSGLFNFSGGAFSGTLLNSVGATTTVTAVAIPFASVINNGRLTVNNGSGTFSGVISGTGTLGFTGTGSIQVTGGSTMTGATTVYGGTITLADPAGVAFAGGVVIDTGATVQLADPGQLPTTLTTTVNGGSLLLGGYAQTVSALSITGGSVQQTTGTGLGLGTGVVTVGKGTASITGGLQTAGGYTFNVASGGSVLVSGSLSSFTSGAQVPSLTVTGGGTLVLSGGSPIVAVDVKQGTLQFNAGGEFLQVNSSVDVESAGVLNLNGQRLLTGDLSGGGRVALGSGTITINSSGSTFSGQIDGSGGVTKQGTGTLTLTGRTQWTGPTNVSVGALTLGSTTNLSSTVVTVAPSATLTVNGGLSTATQLTDNGTVTLAAGTTGTTASPVFSNRTVASIAIGSNYSPVGTVNGNLSLQSSTAGNRTLLYTSALTFAGTAAAPLGQFDLRNNDLVVHNGSLAAVNADVAAGFNFVGGANFAGQGITSSAAAADTTRLTAVGVILNSSNGTNQLYGGTGEPLFDGIAPSASDVLVRYTYFGDTNLDGVVDGSDYTRIDSAFAEGGQTGWANGDFNYDGIIDGSDYTLIDNADNNQGSPISASIAAITAQVAPSAPTSAVPEPAPSAAAITVLIASARRRIANRRAAC
jgi:fibronectin-binding autotransporter adhesin